MGLQKLSIILFRIIAIPLSILWFIGTIHELLSAPSWDQISMQGIALAIFLQGLLFSAALSKEPPWKNKSLIKFVYIFGLLVFYLVLFIGSFFIVVPALKPIVGQWLSGVAAFLVFIALSCVVVIILGKLNIDKVMQWANVEFPDGGGESSEHSSPTLHQPAAQAVRELQPYRGLRSEGLVPREISLKGAIAALNIIIKKDCEDPRLYNNRGNCYLELGNYQEAIKDYDKALDLNPQGASTYYNQGVAYYKIGDKRSSFKNIKMAAQLGNITALSYLESNNILEEDTTICPLPIIE